MSKQISERRFEDAIECALLAGVRMLALKMVRSFAKLLRPTARSGPLAAIVAAGRRNTMWSSASFPGMSSTSSTPPSQRNGNG